MVGEKRSCDAHRQYLRSTNLCEVLHEAGSAEGAGGEVAVQSPLLYSRLISYSILTIPSTPMYFCICHRHSPPHLAF